MKRINRQNALTFSEARLIARESGLKTYLEWKKNCKTIHPNLPSSPDTFYKKEWVDWYDWLDKKRDKRKYNVNDDFFKTWNGEMAYILGFWYADGYIDVSKNIFSICQHKNNAYILENILKTMNSNYNLYYYNNMARLEIKSETIVNDILKLGGKQKKSLTSQFPSIPKIYLPDFTRGLWDGDGCISLVKKTNTYISTFTCGSREFIDDFKNALQDNIPYFKCSLIESSENRTNMVYYLHVAQNSTRRLNDFMYHNNLSLLMMKDKYLKFSKTGHIYKEINYEKET